MAFRRQIGRARTCEPVREVKRLFLAAPFVHAYFCLVHLFLFAFIFLQDPMSSHPSVCFHPFVPRLLSGANINICSLFVSRFSICLLFGFFQTKVQLFLDSPRSIMFQESRYVAIICYFYTCLFFGRI